MRQAPASTALATARVLDLTRARAGPTAVRPLADWGAPVIKSALPGRDETPDFMDRHSPDCPNRPRNTRSMTLHLQPPDGRHICQHLARQVEVIVEKDRPAVTHQLGRDDASLQASHPRLVSASLAGFGQDGP